jgi:hypothetical protein
MPAAQSRNPAAKATGAADLDQAGAERIRAQSEARRGGRRPGDVSQSPRSRRRERGSGRSLAAIASGRTPNVMAKWTVVSVASGSGKPAKVRS